MTTTRCRLPIALAGLLAAITAVPAHADLKITMKMKVQSAQMTKMMQAHPEQRAMMDKMLNRPTTVYTSGSKSYVNSPMMGKTITDAATRKMMMLNDSMHTYMVIPIPASGSSTPPTITSTGKSKVILGHVCKEFLVTGAMGGPGSPTVRQDMWATKDLHLDSSAMAGISPFASQSKVFGQAGVPLLSTITIPTPGQAGPLTVTMQATDVSTAPIPASMFKVPNGYKLAAAPTFPAGMGGGMRRPGGP